MNQNWIRWLCCAGAAFLVGVCPAFAAPPPKAKPPPKAGGKTAVNKERQSTAKGRDHANFAKGRSCGATYRSCLAKCQRVTAPAPHARCVAQGKCDSTYSACMGKVL